MKVVTSQQMRVIDERAQQEFGVSDDELMQAAGETIARRILLEFRPARALIVCGKGNNAGDGFVIARKLNSESVEVLLICLSDPNTLTGAAARAYAKLAETNIATMDCDALEEEIGKSDIVIDAILGTGVRGPVGPPFSDAIEKLNHSKLPIVSVDIPSGLRELADGEELGPCVRAHVTISIGCTKIAMLSPEGLEQCGRIVVERINFPTELIASDDVMLNWATRDELARMLPARPAVSNKGDFGHLGIVGGSAPYAGAAILAARAALRTGCGLVSIFCPMALNPMYKVAVPEAITVPIEGGNPFFLDDASLPIVLDRAWKMNALIIGPGLGIPDSQRSLIAGILEGHPGAALVDADALTALAARRKSTRGLPKMTPDRVVFTPHPGEMARLMQCKVSDIQPKRVEYARECMQVYGATVLLKGAGTIVVRGDEQAWIIPGACAALAKGGTGDVLSGVVGSLLAQGVPAWQAAILGAHLHLQAGLQAQQETGTRGLLASELADQVPHVMDGMEKE